MDQRKRIVAEGYDVMARRYSEWAQGNALLRMLFVDKLLELLADGASVLELGCGSGEPVTEFLARRFRVTGVDISATQLAIASRRVPGASFVRADMATVGFQPASFDAVVALYSITHVPRDQHEDLLRAIVRWLRPGGYVFANMGAGDSPDSVENDWLGVPMFFSHFDAETNRRLVRRAGLDILDAEVISDEEDSQTVSFLWMTAIKLDGE